MATLAEPLPDWTVVDEPELEVPLVEVPVLEVPELVVPALVEVEPVVPAAVVDVVFPATMTTPRVPAPMMPRPVRIVVSRRAPRRPDSRMFMMPAFVRCIESEGLPLANPMNNR